MKILAIIPARGGSKGIPRKNIRIVGGKPLIAWAIEAALGSKVIDKLVVSTDDTEIGEIASQYGAEIINRPTDLAGDEVLTEPVMLHALALVEAQGFTPDFVSLIQCTSPFLSSDIIKKSVDQLVKNQADSCITVFMPDGFEFKWRKSIGNFLSPEHDVEVRPRRQDINLPYHENGAFYITRTKLFKETRNIFGGGSAKIVAVEMSEADSLQIDSEFHLWLANELMKKQKSEA